MKGDEVYTCKADNIIIATGASENTLAFPGWTLPGVMGAGSAQTQMNLHGVMPGKRVLMMGSGNVGLVVGSRRAVNWLLWSMRRLGSADTASTRQN